MGLQFLASSILCEACVGAKPQLADFGRHVREARIQESGAALPGASVSGAQFGVPQKGTVGLQTEQGVVAALAPVPGVVTNLGAALLSEHGDHRAVQIEDET